jgi:SAM-dependent methyltransferase
MISFREKRVLNVGCGVRSPEKLHTAFHARGWNEVRLDIDRDVEPDIVSSIVDMRDAVADESYDALWSSHNIEHLFAHEAPLALREFRRVLRRDGFALITCPDLMSIARLVVLGRFTETIYASPAGPIGVADMLWGHAAAIASGNTFMAHRTGYTAESLGELLIASEFAEAWVFAGSHYDLWAVGLREEASNDDVRQMLTRGGLELPEAQAGKL